MSIVDRKVCTPQPAGSPTFMCEKVIWSLLAQQHQVVCSFAGTISFCFIFITVLEVCVASAATRPPNIKTPNLTRQAALDGSCKLQALDEFAAVVF